MLVVCRIVDDKAVVSPMVVISRSVVDAVENGTVGVVVEIDAGSCPCPPSATQNATMAAINMRENNEQMNKTFNNVLSTLISM